MYDDFVRFVQGLYGTTEFIPLHEPRFVGNEKKYVNEALDSTFVSSVGKFVDQFEEMFTDYTGAKYAVAMVNGTAALHIALKLVGVSSGDEVITQPLTFVATCNAISYCNATPVFVDVDKDSFGLSPSKMELWLQDNAEVRGGLCVNRQTGKVIRACVPMHTFGHPVRIEVLQRLCARYHIELVEDAAESLGSLYNGRQTGTFGRVAAFSFNGNKTITTGGGGMLVTDDEELARAAKYITTTAKVPHRWEYVHDQIGYNYRMPNINAALGCAQLECLDDFITNKRQLAEHYRQYFIDVGMHFLSELPESRANYWLNAVQFEDRDQQHSFLSITNSNGIMTRPVWKLMNRLPMFSFCQFGNLDNAQWLEDRLVNIPSSVSL